MVTFNPPHHNNLISSVAVIFCPAARDRAFVISVFPAVQITKEIDIMNLISYSAYSQTKPNVFTMIHKHKSTEANVTFLLDDGFCNNHLLKTKNICEH
jgi:hypothetical protein